MCTLEFSRGPVPTRRSRAPLSWLASRLGVSLLLTVARLGLGAENEPPAPEAPSPPQNLAALRQWLDAHLEQPRFAAAHWGVVIVSLEGGKCLYAHNAQKLFLPASNAKLYTGALALHRLGPDARFRTSLYAPARPGRGGTLKGDLRVYGRGDPTFAARFHNGDLGRALEPLVAAVTGAGVARIQGHLIADESFFKGPPLGSGWEWDDLWYYYGAQVSALSLNDNAVEVWVRPGASAGQPALITLQPPGAPLALDNRATTAPAGSKRELRFYRPLGKQPLVISGHIPVGDAGQKEQIAAPEPALWFGQAFKEALGKKGIKVSGSVRTMGWLGPKAGGVQRQDWVELGGVESPPLSEIVACMMKPSQNLYAQLLLLQVGARELAGTGVQARLDPAPPATAPSALQTAEEAGLAAMDRFLAEVGLTKGEVLLEEGSGLARRDLVTPAATIRLLQYMHRHPAANAFRAALPVAGVDGTLKNRMKGTAAAGNARAKTGTLSYVHSLSGYLTTAAGEPLAFALYLNNYYNRDPNRPARADLDAIVVTLATLPWTSASQSE